MSSEMDGTNTPSNVVELQVIMNCEGCEKAVRKALSTLHGVERVFVDINQHKVTVQGAVAPEKVLKRVKKAGKHARFWPQAHNNFSAEYVNNAHNNFSAEYVNNAHCSSSSALPSPSKSWNIVNDVHFEVSLDAQSPHLPREEDITTLFSDENPNACSLM